MGGGGGRDKIFSVDHGNFYSLSWKEILKLKLKNGNGCSVGQKGPKDIHKTTLK